MKIITWVSVESLSCVLIVEIPSCDKSLEKMLASLKTRVLLVQLYSLHVEKARYQYY
jgi:hypothetical protein